ncbi:MAG TPA: flippase-like domain-containing protein [Desulfobacteraceae bacterium]|nr:flippase-like domain-containing protein [Desulfobacteraceae bacterium]
MRLNVKKILGTGIRLTIGIGLAYLLINLTLKHTQTDLWNELLASRWSLLASALIFYGAIIAITIWRWAMLLKVQGIYLRAGDIIRLSMLGNFFNLSLPGAVSGDFLKIAFLSQHAKDKKLKAALTVLLDRVIGLFGLFIVAVVMLLIYMPFLYSLGNTYRPVKIAALTVGTGSVIMALAIALVICGGALMHHPRIGGLIRRGKGRLPDFITSRLERLFEALQMYNRTRGTVFKAVLLSVLVHASLAINMFVIGAAVNENGLRLSDYFLATQVSNAIAGIPVTPAGIGARDATMSMFLIALGAPLEKAGVVPVILTLIILFWGLVGGIVFLFTRISKK